VRRADGCAHPNQTDQIFKWSRVPAQSMPPMAWPRLGMAIARAPAAKITHVLLHQLPTLLLLLLLSCSAGMGSAICSPRRRGANDSGHCIAAQSLDHQSQVRSSPSPTCE